MRSAPIPACLLTTVVGLVTLGFAGPTRAAPAAAEVGVPATPAVDMSARDRITFNAGLDALVAGDIGQASALFKSLASGGDTAPVRTAAALMVDRLGGLERRRAAGLVPPLRAPMISAPAAGPEAAAATTNTGASTRAPVVAVTTALGLALWGWSVPTALGLDTADHGRAYLGLYMLTAAASFAVPYTLTRDHPPDETQLNTIFYGGTRGAIWGLLGSKLLLGRWGGDTGDHQQALAASLLVGSVGGAVAGALLAPRLHLSPGDARTIAAVGDYGLFAGLAVGHMIGLDDPARGEDGRARGMAAAGMAGGLAGLGWGHLLAEHRTNTWGDAEVMRGAGALGVLAGATTVIALDLQDATNVLLGFMVAGGGLGLLGGDALVRDTSYTPGESLLIDLALLTGGLGAAGVTYLISNSEQAKPYFIAATLGAAAGGGGIALTVGGHHGGQAHSEARTGPPPLALLPQFGASGPQGLMLAGAF